MDAKPTAQGITGAIFRQSTFDALYYDKNLPGLATTWSLLASGTPLPTPPASSSADPASTDNYLASQLHVLCNDSSWPTSVRSYQRHVATDRRRYPMFGAATADISPCAFWPSTPTSPVRITDRGPADVLIAQNQRDPITPLAGARVLRQAFGNRARLVTADQGGHLAYLAKDNHCLNNTVTAFLDTGALPTHDLACAAEPN